MCPKYNVNFCVLTAFRSRCTNPAFSSTQSFVSNQSTTASKLENRNRQCRRVVTGISSGLGGAVREALEDVGTGRSYGAGAGPVTAVVLLFSSVLLLVHRRDLHTHHSHQISRHLTPSSGQHIAVFRRIAAQMPPSAVCRALLCGSF